MRNDNANKLQELLRVHHKLLTQPFGDKEETLLIEAARTGKNNAVQAILTQARLAVDSSSFSVLVNQRNADGGTALTLAVEHDKPDVAEMLVKHDEVASVNPDLADAIRQKAQRRAKMLVKHRPGSTTITSTNEALLDANAAAVRGHVNTLQALVNQNSELLTKQFGKTKETLLTAAARAGQTGSVQAIVTQALLKRPSDLPDIVNHRNTHGDTALAQAIQHGRLDAAIALLKCDMTDVNLANQNGQAPLHHAAKAKNAEFAIRLLRHEKIQAGQTDSDGNTPLHLAVSETAVAIVGHATASPDHVNKRGQSALAVAIDSKDLLVIDTLLKHPQVNPDRTDSLGRTLLWQSLDKWQSNMSLEGLNSPISRWSHILGRLAASPRVDSNRRSLEGETPLTFLCKLSCPLDIGAVVAFYQWRDRTVQAMLDGSRGQGQLNPAATNAAGKTPYEVALQKNDAPLVEVFLAEARMGQGLAFAREPAAIPVQAALLPAHPRGLGH